jgi:nicotinate-nucleotide pyrophosphorylase (carboxylating)
LPPNRQAVEEIIQRALAEDVGSGDFSSNAVVSQETPGRAVILAKEEGILAGLPVAEWTFRKLDGNLESRPRKCDGDRIRPQEVVAELRGRLLAILSGERVALNFLQRLSGIATATARFVEAVNGWPVKVLDTRKTAPGLRILDKYAVRMGGGWNHRYGLYDAVLLKDNHIQVSGSVGEAVRRARLVVSPMARIEVEVRNLVEVREALEAGAHILLLDNMSVSEMKQAVELINGRAMVEASGGVTLDRVREVASTGVDFISVGAITHSAKALDLSLEVLS